MTSANNIQTCKSHVTSNHTCEQRQFRCLSRKRLLQATKSQSNFLFTANFIFFENTLLLILKERDFLLKFSNPHEPYFYLHTIYFFSFQFLLDQIFLYIVSFKRFYFRLWFTTFTPLLLLSKLLLNIKFKRLSDINQKLYTCQSFVNATYIVKQPKKS